MSSFTRKMLRNGHSKRRADAWVRAATKARPAGDDEGGRLDRMHIVEHNLGTIVEAADKWKADRGSLDDAVVLIVDVDDPVGQQIAKTFAATDKGDEARERGLIPTLTLVVPRSTARIGFGASNPGIGQRLQDAAPAGYYWLACVASGGSTLMAMPEGYDGGAS